MQVQPFEAQDCYLKGFNFNKAFTPIYHMNKAGRTKMRFSFFIILVLLTASVRGQVEREEFPLPAVPSIQFNDRLVTGKVTDASDSRGLEAASVQIFFKDSLISGMITRKNGDFSLSGLPARDSLKVVISGIGYTTQEIWI